MNIFILGLSKSGKTTVSKAIANSLNFKYIDALSWMKSIFYSTELNSSFNDDEYQQFITKWLIINPLLIINHVKEMTGIQLNCNFVIDGITSPKDFVSLFDYREDIVVFLNRINNESDNVDHENIGISVSRDCCFWMSSAGLLNKNNWLEYNFQIPGNVSDTTIKALGSKNSVFIIKSIDNVIKHLIVKIKESK